MLSSYVNTSLCLGKWIKTTPKWLQWRAPNSTHNLRDAVITAKGTSKMQTGFPRLFYCRAKTQFMEAKHTKEMLPSGPSIVMQFLKESSSSSLPTWSLGKNHMWRESSSHSDMNSVYPCWKDDLTLTFSRLSQQGIKGREELSDRDEKRKEKHTQTHRKAIILELSARKPCATAQQQK